MSRRPVTVDADLSLGQFMDEVARSRRYTTYPVLEHGQPIGLLAFARSQQFRATNGTRAACGTR